MNNCMNMMSSSISTNSNDSLSVRIDRHARLRHQQKLFKNKDKKSRNIIMRPSVILSTLFSGLAVHAAMLSNVLVSYPSNVPDDVLDSAKKAVVDAVRLEIIITPLLLG